MMSLDNMLRQYGAEKALILMLMRVYFKKATQEELHGCINKQNINWDFFYELVTVYEIRPIIYSVLSESKVVCENEMLIRLRADCLYVTGTNMDKVREVLRLSAILQKNGVLAVPYKGVFLSKTLFGDFTTRETCDIDFLLLPKDSVAATKILLEDGYETEFYFDEEDEEHIRSISCERSFSKANDLGTQTGLEIHWKLTQSAYDINIANKETFEELETCFMSGVEIKVMNKENLLLSLLVHHGVNDVWRTLKHVVDLAAFLEQYRDRINWVHFKNRVVEVKIEKATQAGFYLAHALLGATIPEGFDIKESKEYRSVLANLFKYPMLNKFKYSVENFSQHLALRDNNADRFSFLLNCFKLLFTPTANDLKWIRLPRHLHFAYFFLKPYRLIRDRING